MVSTKWLIKREHDIAIILVSEVLGMKFCTNCGESLEENVTVCPKCGTAVAGAQQSAPQQPQGQPFVAAPNPAYQQQMYAYDPADHTAEMDEKDIVENKTLAITMYLFGWMGMLIAAIAAKESKFVQFHLRQVLKFELLATLVGIVTLLLCWTIIVPIAASIFYIVLLVVKIIGFVNVCSGKAKELPVVSAFKFL
ncbi:MAG: zinc ribbon domain-containing protein [Butyrivibrio sp.]|nr:zinc ribbon domain-containing protein [Butyrivibrio sp.]